MKVFISWSGTLSHKLGEAFRTWLPGALQLVKPYFTPSDIEKGARWNPEISAELESSNVGIFCMTRENLNSSWILFEAGALSKRLEKSRVCPVLFSVDTSELPGPLSQFQATPFERNEIHKLMQTINAALGDNRLDDKTLDSVFDMWWPRLEAQVADIVTNHEQEDHEPIRTERDMLTEILALSRHTAQRVVNTPQGLHPGAAKDLLEHYIGTHNAVKAGAAGDSIMKELEAMKDAVVYIAKHSRRHPELDPLVNSVSDLSFKCDGDEPLF